MIRLAYDMKKKSQDPKKVSRSKVWIAGHTHADGRPVKPQYAETIEQIQSLDSQMDSTPAADNIREDAVTKILGKDKPGRVRGFGRGITATKLAFLQSRDAKIADMASEIEELKGMKTNGETETSETSAGFKEGVRVQILDCFESEDVVVGEGEFCSDEPMYKIGRVAIGPNAVAVIVKSALISEAFLRRPTTDVLSLEDAVGCKVAWPINKVVLDRNPVASQDVSMVKFFNLVLFRHKYRSLIISLLHCSNTRKVKLEDAKSMTGLQKKKWLLLKVSCAHLIPKRWLTIYLWVQMR
ncbi:uncharacterized protein LOC108824255 isoform X2 [Raphanus sativus]|uniref:Uncharacterized protein LOC108824255 isoform X2 n=1 Tax=Raphanus sativus TaxID=3726 RepID=A0A9W3C6X0_RAPSA|nr:uncharacterized protein LOC108824255 isoform X2 [Raphanus sativus]